jgi:uncharacterized protein YcsI (UPF0317 family)
MPDTTVRVEGLDRLVRTLRKAGDDLNDLKDAHAAAGRIVAADAQARAPRRSGKLAGSIRASRQARRAQVVAGRASIPYGGPIHWGWPSRGISANPFLSDAAQATEAQWLPLYRREIQAALDKVKGA